MEAVSLHRVMQKFPPAVFDNNLRVNSEEKTKDSSLRFFNLLLFLDTLSFKALDLVKLALYDVRKGTDTLPGLSEFNFQSCRRSNSLSRKAAPMLDERSNNWLQI